MMEINQFCNPGELRIGASGQNGVGIVPHRANVDGGRLASHQSRGDTQHPLLAQPVGQPFEPIQEARVQEVRVFAKSLQVHAEHEVYVGGVIVAGN